MKPFNIFDKNRTIVPETMHYIKLNWKIQNNIANWQDIVVVFDSQMR